MDLIALPAPPVTVVELSVPAVVEINLPVVAVSVLPVGFIPMVPEHTTFTASGSGAATVAAKPTTRAAATGVGAVQVLTRAVVAAAASGSGKLTAPAYVIGQAFPTSIEAAGFGSTLATSAAGTSVPAAGSGTLTASPGTTVAATGQGSSTARAVPTVRAAASGVGSGTAAPAGRTTATGTGTGTSAVSGSIYDGAGMDKSGNQTLGGSTWSQITNWTARPGSTVVSNGLMLPAGVTATAVVQVTYGGSNAVNACRVLADGVVAGTSPAGGQVVTATITVLAAATQQLITVEGYVAGLTGGRAVNSSGTFLTLA